MRWRSEPGFHGRDERPGSDQPAVNVKIDRDRAAALGVTPSADRNRAGRGVRRPADFDDLRRVQPVLGDAGTAAAIPERSGGPEPALHHAERRDRRHHAIERHARRHRHDAAGAACRRHQARARHDAAQRQPSGPASGGDDFVQSRAGLRAERRDDARSPRSSSQLDMPPGIVRARSRARRRRSRVRSAISACCSRSRSSPSTSSWAFSMRASSIR